MKDLITKISTIFEISDVIHQRETLTFVTVKKEQAISLVTHCKDYEGFNHFVMLSVVDWIEDGLFQLTYILNSAEHKHDLAIRVMIDREEATMVSAHHLWKQIATYQRELKEMYGIEFPDSPRLNEPFILEGWDDIPPMRRDFDTKQYSKDTFFPREGRETNDPQEYMKKKLYPNAFS